MTELLLLAAVAFATGFGLAWTMRAALARLDLREKDRVIDILEEKLNLASDEYLDCLQDLVKAEGKR